MNIEDIKEEIKNLVGKRIKAKVNIGRNKFEIYEGIVEKTYPFLFTLKICEEIKCFSYADVLTKNIILKKV